MLTTTVSIRDYPAILKVRTMMGADTIEQIVAAYARIDHRSSRRHLGPAGQMLSQSMFDVADGFIVSLPVADYYSVENGRIEGTGVPVDIATTSDEALDKAPQLARETIQ